MPTNTADLNSLLRIGNDIQQSDAYNELGLYYNYGGGGEPDLPDEPVPVDPIPLPRPFPGPILLDQVAVEAQPAIADVAARSKRSIWWPGGGGFRQSFYVSEFNIV